MGAAVGGGRGGKRARIVSINITPMVDVVLVLLVIMMVAAKFIVSQSIKVELPKTASTDGAPKQTAKVTITAKGETLYNDTVVTEAQLVDNFKEALAKDPDVSVVISADKATQHGDVMHVIDLARTNGILKFAVSVEHKE